MNDKTWYCNFCGKHQDEVKQIVTGFDVCICNECVSVCVEIIETYEPPSDLLYPP